MMPTDDERCEVARMLRAFSEKLGHFSTLHLASAIGAEKSDPKSLYGRLADLIEPNPDKNGTCPENVLKASGIDRDALIELADEIRALNENADIHLFGTVRIGDTTLLAIERRIREAVGA